jgi:hypothetical protein
MFKLFLFNFKSTFMSILTILKKGNIIKVCIKCKHTILIYLIS